MSNVINKFNNFKLNVNSLSSISYLISNPPLTGLKLWLKADAGITLSGSNVSFWADQSGNGNDVSQATGTNQPVFNASGINGKPAVTFDSNKEMARATSPLSAGSDRSIIAVLFGRGIVGNSGGIVCSFRSGPGQSYYCYFWENTPDLGAGNSYCFSDAASAAHMTATIHSVPTCYEQYGQVGQYPTMNVNAVAKTTTGALVANDNGTDTFTLCGFSAFTQGFQGDLSEIMIYDHILSPVDIRAIRIFIQNKYGIALGV